MGLYLQHRTLTSGPSGDGSVVAPRTEVKHLLFCCKLWKSVSCVKNLCFPNFTCSWGLLLPVPAIRMYLSAGSQGRLWGLRHQITKDSQLLGASFLAFCTSCPAIPFP